MVVCKFKVMMLHAEIKFPFTSLDEFWTMVIEHAALMYYIFPGYDFLTTESGPEGFIPMEIFSGDNDPWRDECI